MDVSRREDDDYGTMIIKVHQNEDYDDVNNSYSSKNSKKAKKNTTSGDYLTISHQPGQAMKATEQFKMPVDNKNSLKWTVGGDDGDDGGIFGSPFNTGNSAKTRNKSDVSKSIHIKAMKRTQPSIIPEEYEPYSTGHWSRHNYTNPHAAALQSSTQSSFINIKKEVEREFNMY